MYGFIPNRAGFIPCPFHTGDKTPSLKVYNEVGRGFHCHACGAGNSVIDFVMKLFNLTFAQAVVRLNSDFGLGLTNERPDNRELDRLRKERQGQAIELETFRKEYDFKCILHRILWQAKQDFAPKAPDEIPHPLFIAALQELGGLEYWFEENPYR